MSDHERAKLKRALLHIAEETRTFGYLPSRFLQDVARSDPAELVERYVRSPITEGFTKLYLAKRLDLAVENFAWKFRHLFPPDVVEEARRRLADGHFDVETQAYVVTSSGKNLNSLGPRSG